MSESEQAVFVSAQRSGGPTDTYHTDRDCRVLQQARTIHSYPRSHLDDRRDECTVCQGNDGARPGVDQDWSFQRQLRDADPDDTGSQNGDGGEKA